MVDCWINYSSGIIFIYNLTDKSSFEFVKSLCQKTINTMFIRLIVLVGNIKDLNEERKVSFEEAASFSETMKIEYIEISSYNNLNCAKPLEILLNEILLFNKGKYDKYKKNIKRVSKEYMITKQEMKFKLKSLYKYINY